MAVARIMVGVDGSEDSRRALSWAAPLDATKGVRSRRLVEDGPPAMVLLRVACREDVDLIVVGCRGIGGFDELVLGSTSAQLVQHSPVPVPVTVIPREQ